MLGVLEARQERSSMEMGFAILAGQRAHGFYSVMRVTTTMVMMSMERNRNGNMRETERDNWRFSVGGEAIFLVNVYESTL